MSLSLESMVRLTIKLFLLILCGIVASAHASELLSCEELAKLNDSHIQSLAPGMSKDEVLSIMGTSTCPDTENPAKASSFNIGSDVVDVLWYKSANPSGLKPIYLKNGKYGGQKIGFITSPNSGS